MSKPLVSVKMITYNHAAFIAQAIEGVLQQKTNFPVELVIGEDCSTDGTREIVCKYREKFPDIIRVITSDGNVGAKKNWYRTTKACRGKYIAFCEGDDYWHHPEKLQKQVGYLENHTECGLVYSSYDVYHVTSGKKINDFVRYRKWEMPEDWTAPEFIASGGGRACGIMTCTVVIRSDLYNHIIDSDPYLYQSDRFLMGDTQLWAATASLSKMHFIPVSMATYNVTAESATRSSDIEKRLRFSVSNAELMMYLCDKYNVNVAVKARYINYWYSSAMRLAFHSHNSQLAELARKTAGTLSFKQWLQYYGAKNHFLHSACYLIINALKPFRNREYYEWL